MTKEEHIRSLFGDSARILKEDEDTMTLEINLTSYENGGDPLSRRPLPPAQVHLAEEISAYLSAHMDRHTTIKELGEIFHVSPTQVKPA